MITKTANGKIHGKQQASLKRRIRRFYEFLNRHEFARCHQMIDPRVRDKPSSVTLLQYGNALGEFVERVGSIMITDIRIDVHLDEPSKLYEGRDFALGQTSWKGESGEEHVFQERWVREGRTWFTRSTGFVVNAKA